MKRIPRSIISMIIVLAMVAFVTPAAFASGSDDWNSLTEHYTVNEDGTVTSTGACESVWNTDNFCVNNSYSARGDYTVSVRMQGTMGFPNTTQVQEGVIPWYLDADNYLFVYAQWSESDRTGQMHQIHISGKINGTAIGYDDHWTDGVEVSNDTALTLKVSKTTVDGAVVIGYELTGGSANLTGSRTLDAAYTEKLSEEGLMGVYAFGNGVNITFSEFTSTAPAKETGDAGGEAGGDVGGDVGGEVGGEAGGDDSGSGDPQAPTGQWTGLTEHYTIHDDGTVTSTGACESVWNTDSFCLNNYYTARGDYTVSVRMQGTMGFPNGTQVQEGIIPWYQDADNYLFVYVQWSNDNRPNEMHQLHISGRIGGQSLGFYDCWTDGVAVSNDTALTLKVSKTTVDGAVVIGYELTGGSANLTGSRTLDAAYTEKLSEEGRMGVYAFGNGIYVTFSDFTSTAPRTDLAPKTGDIGVTMAVTGMLAAVLGLACAALVPGKFRR